MRANLLQAGAFAGDQFIENGQDLFAVNVGAVELYLHLLLIAVAGQELVDELLGNVDIPAERFSRMTTQKEPVEQRRFALRRSSDRILRHARPYRRPQKSQYKHAAAKLASILTPYLRSSAVRVASWPWLGGMADA